MDKTVKIYYIIIFLALVLIIILFIPLIILFEQNPIKKTNEDKSKNIIPIQSQRNLISIKIIKLPQKIYYKEGEIFDKSGMIIKGIYDDNTQSYIDNYIIDKNSPLTIYDSELAICYKDKKTFININIVNDENIEIIPNPSKEQYTLEPIDGIITRFEIEDSDISNWIISNNIDKIKIIKRNDASGGYFLSGIDENISFEGKLVFNLDLKYNAEIIMSVSYSQKENWNNYNIDISSIYTFIIDENKNIKIDDEKYLTPREDITKWQIIKYKTFSLPKGKHTISLIANSNTETASPNIDYIDFKTNQIKEIPIEPDIEEMPSNDFHTLLQYNYIIENDPEKILNYANGIEDLSRPKGNILNFADSVKEISDSYVIQISSSENFDSSDTKIIKLKEKKYILKNLKLNQKIYYRGAINNEELKNSKIYELKVNNLAPRNLDIPGVDNSRDIGGVETTLVENGIINQGLYYRTAKIDDINEEGKKILTEDLGVKIEIDLRDEIYNNGPYVDGVEYYPIPIPTGTSETRFEKFEEEYIKVFDLIAEADKNPIVLHCSAGADRTGIMSFALMTLLGCKYNDIARDYLFTNFGVQGLRDINSEFIKWWNKLDNYNGETKAERCKSWLMSKGIKEEKLEHIREIFIDGYKENKNLKDNKNEELNGYNIKIKYNNRLKDDINNEIINFNNSEGKNKGFIINKFLAFKKSKKIFN